jgi:hypothetical protein
VKCDADEDVARLQKALLETKREAEALSIALESPENNGRWRLLDGKIPDKDELGAKIMQLDERLNAKKESLLEKELILDEITMLSDRLREQASEGRSVSSYIPCLIPFLVSFPDDMN